ncbi:hypothetical protein EYR41_008029 [Orbilia oligospora]|uniref:Uncharacterized protein n=1 Tax=Orbilia oligospora TaxID=2813651 RepID=A0A7C8PRS8_ORBOL|nr:hypothetical protein TWF751_002767 [Orbilia oligospora]TGJ66393.1 hypothetical protein EYR41_008029 [Orbilia oligospora]
MAAFTLGTFIRLAQPHDSASSSIEAALSVPEGVWAFKYDTTNSFVSASWTQSNKLKKPKAKNSRYRLRLWSGSEPQNMELNGMEQTVEFDLNNPPWEQQIERITLDICFWFGIERVGDGSGSSNSNSQTWSDLIQELENTTRIYTYLNTLSVRWKPIVDRFQKANQSIKDVDQKTIAQGRRAEWIWREMRGLQTGIEELRRIISTGEPFAQNDYIESTKAGGETSEDLKLEKEMLEEEKTKLQKDIKKLKKKIATNDVDITELSETVYRLQCENDILKGEETGEGTGEGIGEDAIDIALDEIKSQENEYQGISQRIVQKERPRENRMKHRSKSRDRAPVFGRKNRDKAVDSSPLMRKPISTTAFRSRPARLQEYQPARQFSDNRIPPVSQESPRLSRNTGATFLDADLKVAPTSLNARGATQYAAPTAHKNKRLPQRPEGIPIAPPDPVAFAEFLAKNPGPKQPDPYVYRRNRGGRRGPSDWNAYV